MCFQPLSYYFLIEDDELLLRIAIEEISELFVKMEYLKIRLRRLEDDIVSQERVDHVASLGDEDYRIAVIVLDDEIDDLFEIRFYGGFDFLLTKDTDQPLQIHRKGAVIGQLESFIADELLNLDQADVEDVIISLVGCTLEYFHFSDKMVAALLARLALDLIMVGT